MKPLIPLSPTPRFLIVWTIINMIMFSIASTSIVFVCTQELGFESVRFAPFPGAIVGLVMGVSQEVLLFHFRLGFNGQWSLITAIGGMIGWWMGGVLFAVLLSIPERFLPDSIGAIFGVFVIGLCLGFCPSWGQYFLLKRHLKNPWRWVVASSLSRAIGWLISGGLFYVTILVVKPTPPNPYLYISPWGGAIIGLLYGGATALVLKSSRSTE
jgi:hypothetical protein